MPGKSFRHMSINHDDYIDSHTGRVQHGGGRGAGGGLVFLRCSPGLRGFHGEQ